MDFKIKGNKITNKEKFYLEELGCKWCSKCKCAKPYEEFSKSNQTADGYDGRCKQCVKQIRLDHLQERRQKDKEYYQSNKDLRLKQVQEYRKNNPDKIKEARIKYYDKNKDVVLKRNSEYRENNLEYIKNQQKEYHNFNKEHRSYINKLWRENNKIYTRKYLRDKYNNDKEFRLRMICRGLVRRMILATGVKKQFRSQEILGYTPQQLKQHIELQFKDEMTWENYGKWQIDHKIPISSATNLFEGIQLSQLENLQPLWAEENLAKSNKIINYN